MMKILSGLLAFLLCIGGFVQAMGESTGFLFESAETQTPINQETAEQADQAEAPWTYPISREILDDPLDVIRLVNKENRLEKDYPTEELVKTSVRKAKNQTYMARQVASDALDAMFAAADEDGIKLYMYSAYRSYSTQATMYDNRLKKYGYDDGIVQAPGASDHQTGLGFDIVSKDWINASGLTSKFANTKEAQWMAANCARFGFIIRYPEGKKDITGISFEPWHLRYVGIEAAEYMTGQGLTLEEFTTEWTIELARYEAQSSWNTDNTVDSFSF